MRIVEVDRCPLVRLQPSYKFTKLYPNVKAHIRKYRMAALRLINALSSVNKRKSSKIFEKCNQCTHDQILLMIFWQTALLMNRLALPRMAISIAFPTRSSRSSSLSCLARSMRWGSAPEYTGQLVVKATASWSVSFASSRQTRVARISHRAAREHDMLLVATLSSRRK